MTGRKGPSAELGPPHFMNRLAPTLLILVLAGCGGASAPKHAATKNHGPKCSAIVSGASTRVIDRGSQLVTCSYAAHGERLRITFDDGPSAWFRYRRAFEERTQTTVEWANTPNQQPKAITHIGAGAFWVPATRELVASNGRRLLTIRVQRPAKQALALARRVAPHGLGPNDVPVSTGP
jgi:hypothetical protein